MSTAVAETRLAGEPSGSAAAAPARTRTGDGGAAIASAGSRVNGHAVVCPTCHAEVGRPCLRSPGRRGRRRPAGRKSPHLARLELATALEHRGVPLGELSAPSAHRREVRAGHPQR